MLTKGIKREMWSLLLSKLVKKDAVALPALRILQNMFQGFLNLKTNAQNIF